jgi:hypothetical protein
VNSKPTVVDLLELRAAANVFGWPEFQIYSLLTVRRLRPFRTAPLQHEAPVLGAHPHQKPMRALAVARVGLKRPHSLSHDIPSE